MGWAGGGGKGWGQTGKTNFKKPSLIRVKNIQNALTLEIQF